jgi:hypothetical protein
MLEVRIEQTEKIVNQKQIDVSLKQPLLPLLMLVVLLFV